MIRITPPRPQALTTATPTRVTEPRRQTRKPLDVVVEGLALKHVGVTVHQ